MIASSQQSLWRNKALSRALSSSSRSAVVSAVRPVGVHHTSHDCLASSVGVCACAVCVVEVHASIVVGIGFASHNSIFQSFEDRRLRVQWDDGEESNVSRDDPFAP